MNANPTLIVANSKKCEETLLYKELAYKYEPDFIIEDKIIVEIKSMLLMPEVIENQLYYYLRGTNYKLGYLVNFGTEKIDIRRRIYEKARYISVNSR